MVERTNPGPSPACLRVLELGLGWFEEQAGGLDRVFSELLAAFSPESVTARGLVAGSAEVFKKSGGQVSSFALASAALPNRLINARKATLQAVHEFRPDLVAAHFALYALPSLDRIRKLPFVFHFHGPWAAEGSIEGSSRVATSVKTAIEKAVYARADALIVLSNAFRDVLVNDYRVSPQRIRVISGGVNFERFNAFPSPLQAQQALGWVPGRTRLLTVRRLVPRMGIDNLLAAVDIVGKQYPNLDVVIVGKGPLRNALEDEIRQRGLKERVRLVGYVPDDELPAYFAAADFSIVPSVALEGFGLTTLESLASGTPVLVTPVGGLPEAVQGLSPSLILESTGVMSLVRGIEAFLENPSAFPAREECRRYAELNFSWEAIASRTATVYREVIK